MNQQESPITDKTQEKVTFITPSLRYILCLNAGRQAFDRQGILEVIPAKFARFEEGKFSTDDPEEIRMIRESKPFRHGRIKEITEAIKKVMAKPLPQKTHRGAITAGGLRREAGVKEKPQAIALQEKGVTACDVPGCGYTAENDFGGRKVNMHKIAKHRRWAKEKKPETEVKK